jgi:hypothetical protein
MCKRDTHCPMSRKTLLIRKVSAEPFGDNLQVQGVRVIKVAQTGWQGWQGYH